LRAQLALLIALAALLLPHDTLRAQQVEREFQVALDAERGVLEIDVRLRSDLGLFPEIQNFLAARLFRNVAGEHVLEISFLDQGTLAHERRPLTATALDALRRDVADRLAAQGRARIVDRSGRAGFVLGQTAVGLGYHGWAVPVMLDLDSGRGVVAAYLLTSGASFLVPWMVTANTSVSDAQRDAAFWGATRGIPYGLIVGDMVRPERRVQDPDGYYYESDDDALRTRLAFGSAVSVLGSVLGYQAAGLADHDPGTVALWSVAGDFGLAGAFGTSYALGLYEGEECYRDVCYRDDFQSTRAGHAVTLGLGLASLYGAKLWGERERYTVGDARALRSFGLLGAQALLPLAVELFDDEEGDGGRGVAGSAVLGGVGALYLGNRVLRNRSLSGGDGLLVLTGHLAGGLVAAGVTYLLDSGEDADPSVYLATTAAGSAIGSILTFRSVRGGPRAPGTGALPLPATTRGIRAAEVTFHPQGVIAPLVGLARSADDHASPRRSAPLLTLRF